LHADSFEIALAPAGSMGAGAATAWCSYGALFAQSDAPILPEQKARTMCAIEQCSAMAAVHKMQQGGIASIGGAPPLAEMLRSVSFPQCTTWRRHAAMDFLLRAFIY
jgi:hypothetical protein